MLADGFATRRGRRGALVHRDEVNGRIRGRRGARLLAITSGGAIPDIADYRVLLEPERHVHRHGERGLRHREHGRATSSSSATRPGGSCGSSAGPCAWRTPRAQPPTIPFWLGEAPARSDELSRAVSELRAELERRLDDPGGAAMRLAGAADRGARPAAAEQLVEYLARGAVGARRAARPRTTLVARAVLRRVGRHAARAARAVRQPGQPGLGARAAEALLPPVQLRAAGRGHRGRAAALARTAAFLPAGRRLPLPPPRHGARRAGAGAAGRAGVRDALALERHHLAGRPAEPERDAGPAAAPAHAGRRPAGRRLSRRRRLPREHRRRPGDPRPSAGATDRSSDCLDEAMDFDGLVAVLERDPARGDPLRRPRHCPSRRRSRTRSSTPSPTPSSTTRRSRSAAPRPSTPAAPASHAPPTTWARSTRPRSRGCATRRGPTRATPTSCTTRCSLSGFLTLGDMTEGRDGRSWTAVVRRARATGRAGLIEPSPGGRSGSPPSAPARRWPWRPGASAAKRRCASSSGAGWASSGRPRARSGGVARASTRADGRAGSGRARGRRCGAPGRFSPTSQGAHGTRMVRAPASSPAFTATPCIGSAPRSSRSAPADFIRFLFDWQRLRPSDAVAGLDGLAAVIDQLDGYEVPAGAWESEVLRRGARNTIPRCSTCCVSPAGSPGAGSARGPPGAWGRFALRRSRWSSERTWPTG